MELTKINIQRVLEESLLLIKSELKSSNFNNKDLSILHYINDIELHFVLNIINNDVDVLFEKPHDADVIIDIDVETFHKIQIGEISPLLAGMKGKLKIKKGAPTELLALQKLPIAKCYKDAVKTISAN